MNNGHDEERGHPYTPYTPPAEQPAPPPESGWARETQYAPGPANNGAHNPQPERQAGAPAERADAPALADAHKTPQTFAAPARENPAARAPSAHADGWREPMYSAAHETTSNMYTPGLYVDPAPQRKRAAENETARRNRVRSGRLGGFVRAVCLVVVCALLSGASTYLVIEYRFNKGDFNTVNQVVLGGTGANNQQVGNLTAPVSTAGAGMSAEDIYEIACTQVVGIITEMPASNMPSIFGNTNPGSSTAASGSGFIISNDGYILTNYHVVETAYWNDLTLTVCLNDGAEYKATVVGYDALSDIALIKIDATGLNAALIANSANIRVGEKVYAVGNPFGDLAYTMTDGIVSALDRVVSVDSGTTRKNINTFQFSAAVNPGNSGGPVYNTNGEVIGIVSVKIMGSSVEGIGFAIPINDAIEFASELIEHGYIAGRAFMGIGAETMNRGNAEYFAVVEGAYVKTVNEGSAADKAGIMFGDIITKLGEDDITSRESLVYTLRKFRAGDTTTVTIWRGGESIELTITFDENMTAGQPERP